MSQLKALLAKQVKLTQEVATLETLLAEMGETQVLTVGSASTVMSFEKKDMVLGLKIHGLVADEYTRLDTALTEVNAKVAAIELLVG